MSQYHPDENMRGKHLLDTKTGEVWPWTKTLSKKPGFKLVDDPKTFIEEHPKVQTKQPARLKMPKIEMPKPVPVPEDASIADALIIYGKEAAKKVK